MTWQQAMTLACYLNRAGWRARVFGQKNINGVWLYRAEPSR